MVLAPDWSLILVVHHVHEQVEVTIESTPGARCNRVLSPGTSGLLGFMLGGRQLKIGRFIAHGILVSGGRMQQGECN